MPSNRRAFFISWRTVRIADTNIIRTCQKVRYTADKVTSKRKKSKKFQKTLYKRADIGYYRQAVRKTGADRTLKTEQIHVRFI